MIEIMGLVIALVIAIWSAYRANQAAKESTRLINLIIHALEIAELVEITRDKDTGKYLGLIVNGKASGEFSLNATANGTVIKD